MKYRKTMLSASIVAALCLAGPSWAQDTGTMTSGNSTSSQKDSKKQPVQNLNAITVTGIRASLQKSLQTKRNADSIVDAVTAEDIGKFPNTNVAEAMTLIPGVTIDRKFGQGARVSIDGTDPSLNLSFLDNHPVSQTAWLYGTQPDRGFDYTMLAPEILGRLEVYKSSQARLPSGSLGGTVIMHTREPLDMKANTVSASIGTTYNGQAGKSRPQGSILYSWKNDAHNFGFDVAISHYEEQIDRQGEEVFGYQPVSDFASNPAVASRLASGALRPNDLMPQEINAAYFQQRRKRNTALVNLQYKPTDRLEFDLQGLYIREKFNNFNQSMYGFTSQTGASTITSLSAGNNGIVYAGHSCGIDDPGCSGHVNTYLDNQVRTSRVTTKGLDLRGKYRGDGWSIAGQAGVSKANNNSNAQYFIEPSYWGGYTWNIKTGQVFDNPNAARDPANWSSHGGWFGNEGRIPSNAKDTYAKLNFTKDFDSVFNELLIGVRYHKEKHNHVENVYGGVTPGSLATVGNISYTDILNSTTFAGFSPDQRHHVQSTAGAIKSYVQGSPINFNAPDPGSYLNNTWKFQQTTKAAYAQLDFAADALRGNLGVRFVHTQIDGTGYNFSGAPTLPAPSGWFQTQSSSHNNWLPSVNLVYDTGGDTVLRFAAAKVIAWAPYNQMVNYAFLNDQTLTGSGGNPKLDPYKSYNFNFSAEWYFADQSVLAGSVFYKHILNYVQTQTQMQREYNSMHDTDPSTYQSTYVGKLGNCTSDGYCDYSMLRPYNIGAGTVKGFTVSYQQPFGDSGFGLLANYTYADGSTAEGHALPYNSKNDVKLSPYFEKGPFSARVTYGWRSHYLAGGYVAGAPPASVAAYSELDANFGWTFNKHISLTLDAMNLLNEKYFTYLGNKDMPAGIYTNGRRYMANLHFKF